MSNNKILQRIVSGQLSAVGVHQSSLNSRFQPDPDNHVLYRPSTQEERYIVIDVIYQDNDSIKFFVASLSDKSFLLIDSEQGKFLGFHNKVKIDGEVKVKK